jgi:hypothetical protein
MTAWIAGLRTFVRTSPFAVLARAFFVQFFTSESATSDAQLRQAMILAITFLLPPGLFMMVMIFPMYENIFAHHPSLVDEARLRLALVLMMYAMATIGYIAVFVWEGLTFERRDAMVIGPLPLSGATVIGAKLTALATLLLGAALTINLMTAVPFGSVTANHVGVVGMIRDTVALLLATLGAATFVFSSMVVTRAAVTLLGTPRMAARLGSLLQFLFVAGILCFLTLLPVLLNTRRAAILASAGTTPNPVAWFLGLFEYLHGSAEPGFATLAGRALVALAIVVTGAVVVSIVAVRQQMQRALVPVASAGALGRALVTRAVARALVGRDPVARATADFILLTIARNRAQQGPIAISSAIGSAIIVATLFGLGGGNALNWSRPTVDLLSVPLVLVFWMAVGMRGAFFVPSELPAAWAFRMHASASAARSYWSATRAAMMGVVLPPGLLIAALLALVLDWRIAAWHALVVAVMTLLLVQVLTLTITHIPFILPYEPGHARLRTRWPLYLFGMNVFAWAPARAELWLLTAARPSPGDLVTLAIVVVAMVVILEAIGRRSADRWRVEEPEQSVDDAERLSVLDLGATVAR